MKQIYCCDLCGEAYESEEECKKCEAFHIEPKMIEAGRFVPITKSDMPYIDRVIVRMQDDSLVQYAFEKILDKDNVKISPNPRTKNGEDEK